MGEDNCVMKHTIHILHPHQSNACHFFLDRMSRFECVPLLKRKLYG